MRCYLVGSWNYSSWQKIDVKLLHRMDLIWLGLPGCRTYFWSFQIVVPMHELSMPCFFHGRHSYFIFTRSILFLANCLIWDPCSFLILNASFFYVGRRYVLLDLHRLDQGLSFCSYFLVAEVGCHIVEQPTNPLYQVYF